MLSSFDEGYRKGVRFTLIQLMNMSKDYKIKIDRQSIKLNVYLEALINDLDVFIDFGDNTIFVYEEHDKKKIPIKAKAVYSIKDYLLKRKMNKIKKLVTVLLGDKIDVAED